MISKDSIHQNEDNVYYLTCRFCGNMELAAGEYDSQEQANEAATIRCGCMGARDYQNILKQKKEREENVAKLRSRLDGCIGYCLYILRQRKSRGVIWKHVTHCRHQ